MESLQAIVTGAIAGALMQVSTNLLAIDVAISTDDEGNYLPEVLVTGRESGERLRVTVEAVKT